MVVNTAIGTTTVVTGALKHFRVERISKWHLFFIREWENAVVGILESICRWNSFFFFIHMLMITEDNLWSRKSKSNIIYINWKCFNIVLYTYLRPLAESLEHVKTKFSNLNLDPVFAEMVCRIRENFQYDGYFPLYSFVVKLSVWLQHLIR